MDGDVQQDLYHDDVGKKRDRGAGSPGGQSAPPPRPVGPGRELLLVRREPLTRERPSTAGGTKPGEPSRVRRAPALRDPHATTTTAPAPATRVACRGAVPRSLDSTGVVRPGLPNPDRGGPPSTRPWGARRRRTAVGRVANHGGGSRNRSLRDERGTFASRAWARRGTGDARHPHMAGTSASRRSSDQTIVQVRYG